jgi:pyruvate ferredoxin oxidoreductase alpha subunit
VHDVVAGLGGRPITKASLRRLFLDAAADRLDRGLTFLDLDRELVERELRRAGDLSRPGPHAESILRQIGAVAAGPV